MGFFFFISLPQRKKILYGCNIRNRMYKTLLRYFYRIRALLLVIFFDYALEKFNADIGSFACKFLRIRRQKQDTKRKQLGFFLLFTNKCCLHRSAPNRTL